MPLRLNIGCGGQVLPGWVNIDISPTLGAIGGLVLHLPVGDDSAECAILFDVVEHLHPTREALRALKEIGRVLRPGGVLRVSTPDLRGLAHAYVRENMAGWGAASQPAVYGAMPAALQFSAHAFGNLTDEGGGRYLGHQVLYDEESLSLLLAEAGFREVQRQRPRESLSEAIRLQVTDRWPETALIVECVKWQ